MTQTPAAVGSARRLLLIPMVTVLAAFTLAACGTEGAAGGGSLNGPAEAVGARPAAPPGPDEQVAFMEMLNSVEEPCVPDTPVETEPVAPGERPPTAPVEPLPVGKTPPADAGPVPDASASPREVELDVVEKCAGRLHAERITTALRGLTDPTPARVRKALSDLGYIDERIHGLRRSGPATQFFLDLRVMGGSLCLEGLVAGTGVVVEAFGINETGPFTPVKRER